MNYPYHLEKFVAGYLASQGALVERVGYGVHEAILDEALSERLGKPYLVLAFDYDAAVETKDAEFISYGNAVFERLTQMAVHDHCGAIRYVESNGRVPAVQSKVIEHLKAPASKFELIDTRMYFARCFRFNFKVAFLSEEREEVLQYHWVDGPSGRLLQDYSSLPHIFFSDTPPGLQPQLSTKPMNELFAVAVSATASSTHMRRLELDRQHKAERAEDLARTQAYFGALIEESKVKLSRAIFNRDEKLRLELQNKELAIEGQKRHHIQDVLARYETKCEIELLDLVCYVVPRWRIRYFLHSGAKTAETVNVIWWDEVSKSLLSL